MPLGVKKILAIVPARGGSKGVARKNIRELGGKPLLEWTLNAALNSDFIDKVVVSTECCEIANVAINFGIDIPFMRPQHLSRDDTTVADVVEHVLTSLDEQYEEVVLLQPTSPFRSSAHITDALRAYCKLDARSLVSVCQAEKSPYWMFTISEDRLLKPLLTNEKLVNRRQDLPAFYQLNGAIYVVNVSLFLKKKKFVYSDTVPYVMDHASSLDIDTLVDFQMAEAMLAANDQGA